MELNVAAELEELFRQYPPLRPARVVEFEEDLLDEGSALDAFDVEDVDDDVEKAEPSPGEAHVPSPDWTPRKPRGMRRRVDLPEVTAQITKVHDDQQLVYGWASVIENPDGTPHIDQQGDVLDEAELMKAAHAFMNVRELGESHRTVTGLGKIVESLVVTKALKTALNLPASTPTGWLIGVRVESPDVWARVKAGELTAFSIGGTGVREPM
jgi:hypothetical protein